MRFFRFVPLLVFLFAVFAPASRASPGEVYVARVDGVISPSTADFIVGAIHKIQNPQST